MPSEPNVEELLAHALTRRQLLQRLGAGGAALTLPGILAACGGADDEATATEPAGTGETTGGDTGAQEIDTLTWALPAGPRTLDIATSFDTNSTTVQTVGLEPLVVYDDELALQPVLAESWDQPDASTLVYQIREGVTFWDGSPLTAEDVVASLSRHLDPDTGSQINYYWGSVDTIEATGPMEVTVKSKKPDPFVQYAPAFTHIMPKAFLDEHGKDVGTPAALVMGTGPYQVTEFTPDQSVTWERVDTYWGEAPPIQKIVFRFITENATRLLAVRSGEVDGTFDVPLDQSDEWEQIEGVNVEFTPGLRVWYFSFDVEAEPWSDVHVRRAFQHAVDKQGLIDTVVGGHGQIANTTVPRDQWGSLVPAEQVDELYASIPTYEFDLEQARAELAQSAFAGGFKASVQYPNSRPQLGKAALNLSENLRELGIEITVNEVTNDKWLNDIYAHKDLGLTALGFGPDYPDPANYAVLMFHSAGAVENAFNTANYKSPQVDSLLDKQTEETDPALRAEALGEVLKITAEDAAYLPLWWEDVGMSVKEDFTFTGFNAFYYYQNLAEKVRSA